MRTTTMTTRSERLLIVNILDHLFVQDVNTQPIEGMYDPAEFADLDVAQVISKS